MARVKSRYAYKSGALQGVPVVVIRAEFVIPGDLIEFIMDQTGMGQRAAVNAIFNQYASWSDLGASTSGVGVDGDGNLVWSNMERVGYQTSLLEEDSVEQFRRDGEMMDLGQDDPAPGFRYR